MGVAASENFISIGIILFCNFIFLFLKVFPVIQANFVTCSVCFLLSCLLLMCTWCPVYLLILVHRETTILVDGSDSNVCGTFQEKKKLTCPFILLRRASLKKDAMGAYQVMHTNFYACQAQSSETVKMFWLILFAFGNILCFSLF